MIAFVWLLIPTMRCACNLQYRSTIQTWTKCHGTLCSPFQCWVGTGSLFKVCIHCYSATSESSTGFHVVLSPTVKFEQMLLMIGCYYCTYCRALAQSVVKTTTVYQSDNETLWWTVFEDMHLNLTKVKPSCDYSNVTNWATVAILARNTQGNSFYLRNSQW